MASTLNSPAMQDERDDEVALWRLYLMRAACLAGAVALFPQWLLAEPDLSRRGMIDGMLAGLWVMTLVGLRYPLKMLPILLFEFVWKTVWLLGFGLPQWMAGRVDPQLDKDLWGIGIGPLVFGLIIPWGYVWRHFFKQPAERWR